MVVLLPAFLVNDVGMGDPFFCKYLCPQGVLEGAIPLSLANSGIRGLPHRGVSGGGGLVKVSLFLLYHRISHPVRGFAGTLYLRFSVSLRLASGAAA